MGVNNSDEAYMATKQALYRYLAGQDETYYGGGGIGEAGQRVYNAIAKLLDYGYNYSESVITAMASITQEKTLDFDNVNTNYYSATYSVSSNTTFQHYVIRLDTDKTGILITDLNNNIKSKFSANEKFKILVPRSEVTNNFNIGINAYLSCETKAIFYGNSQNENLQSYVITTDPYEDVSTHSSLTAQKLQESGQITINKIDKDTKKPISDVTFELYKNGTKIASEVTNSAGKAIFSNLDEGDYVIKEQKTNSSYILNTNSEFINISLNEQKEITITNEHKKGSLRIVKLDKDDQKVTLGGVVFSLYNKELGKTVGTYTTNSEVEIIAEILRTGD